MAAAKAFLANLPVQEVINPSLFTPDTLQVCTPTAWCCDLHFTRVWRGLGRSRRGGKMIRPQISRHCARLLVRLWRPTFVPTRPSRTCKWRTFWTRTFARNSRKSSKRWTTRHVFYLVSAHFTTMKETFQTLSCLTGGPGPSLHICWRYPP